MKVEVLSKEVFTPIKLDITIESEKELCDLWNRLNLSVDSVKEHSYNPPYLKYGAIDDSTFFRVLDNLIDSKYAYLINK